MTAVEPERVLALPPHEPCGHRARSLRPTERLAEATRSGPKRPDVMQ
jgi:hypothetical protein